MSKILQPSTHSSGDMTRRQAMGSAAGLAAATALPQAASAQTPKRGGHLIAGLNNGSASDSLDPGRWTNLHMQTVGAQLTDALFAITPKMQLEPALAEGWDVKPGAKEWVFKLRK